MPTPLQILLNPISLFLIGMYAALMAWEAIWPGRKLPYIKYWRVKGIASFFLFFYLSTYLPMLWNQYLIKYQLFDLTGIGTFAGAVCGILLYEFGQYVWHRTMHRNDFLWKTMHQLHHSAERIDTYGAFYFSPFDMIGWTMLSSICLVLVVGLSPQSATIAILVSTFLGMFQHTNVKTPQWLGYLVQRPESHTIHHARGIHAYNYSDLPIFDILFGTFNNPKKYEHQTGFYDGASARVSEMLIFKDVTTPQKTEEVKQVKELETVN